MSSLVVAAQTVLVQIPDPDVPLAWLLAANGPGLGALRDGIRRILDRNDRGLTPMPTLRLRTAQGVRTVNAAPQPYNRLTWEATFVRTAQGTWARMTVLAMEHVGEILATAEQSPGVVIRTELGVLQERPRKQLRQRLYVRTLGLGENVTSLPLVACPEPLVLTEMHHA